MTSNPLWYTHIAKICLQAFTENKILCMAQLKMNTEVESRTVGASIDTPFKLDKQ